MIKNRLKYWRHYLQIDKQTEFAEILGVTQQQLNKWENQKGQPNTETLLELWKILRNKIPGLNLQDLLEHDDS